MKMKKVNAMAKEAGYIHTPASASSFHFEHSAEAAEFIFKLTKEFSKRKKDLVKNISKLPLVMFSWGGGEGVCTHNPSITASEKCLWAKVNHKLLRELNINQN